MKLIMTKGLPGSGKTTWAKEQLKKGNWKRVNKDDLRRMLDNGKWSKNNEKFIIDTRDNLVLAALDFGFNVIVDDTNLHPKHEIRLKELANLSKVEFEIKDFTDVPIEECIKRDLLRLESVGEAVIRKQYKQFLAPKTTYVFDDKKEPAIICDIDGTLALFEGNPYERDFSQDKINNVVRSILQKYKDDADIILLSGRKDTYRKVTSFWLSKYNIEYDALHMRKADDNRKDYIIKREMYEQYVEPRFNVLFVLDDRNQVVDLWRGLGLTCLQVADGDF